MDEVEDSVTRHFLRRLRPDARSRSGFQQPTEKQRFTTGPSRSEFSGWLRGLYPHRKAISCGTDNALLHRLQAGDDLRRRRAGRHLRPANLPAGVPVPAKQGRRRGSHAGRPVQGHPEGRRVPRRRGAVVVDLPDHLQHRDVAAAHGEASAAPVGRNGDARRAAADQARACRLVEHGRRAGVPGRAPAARAPRDPGAAGDLPGAGRAARSPGNVDRGSERACCA